MASSASAVLSCPIVGVGTHCVKGQAAFNSVKDALEMGYRLVDTAAVYKNEVEVGQAIRSASATVLRGDIFLTTKLAPQDQNSYDAVIAAFHQSLERLETPYVDCFMMHWPATGGLRPEDPRNVELRRACWHAMEDLRTQGKCRFLGTSNFLPRHLLTLPSLPTINQVEMHPRCQQAELVKFCGEHGIHLQSYSPLGRGDAALLGHEAVVRCGVALSAETKRIGGVSNAQAVLLGALHLGASSVLARSTKPTNLRDNFDVANIWSGAVEHDTACRSQLETMVCAFRNDPRAPEKHYCWDPAVVI